MLSRGRRFVTVVGVDFSPMSLRALDEALTTTSLRAGEVHAVYVEPERTTDLATLDAAGERLQKCAQERVSLAGALAVTRVVAHIRRGSPAREIAELAANLDADLVVMGSHGRHGVERFFLGSVAERVLRLCRCPVWIIRPKEHAAELKVPEIEPPCPECVARREATGGVALWCKRHSEHHIRPHRYAYVQNGIYSPETTAYEATPEA